MFTCTRTVRFQDTDAAGVVYFANLLSICHEAYETSLAACGIDLKAFFSGSEVVFPITHVSGNFFKPAFCGDRLEIHLTPKQLTSSEFEISYEIVLENRPEKPITNALTRHVCIDPSDRTRKALPAALSDWLQQWR
jgi:1,4-dihydroxy-2-naphthoyl-CoA hydrolase